MQLLFHSYSSDVEKDCPESILILSSFTPMIKLDLLTGFSSMLVSLALMYTGKYMEFY